MGKFFSMLLTVIAAIPSGVAPSCCTPSACVATPAVAIILRVERQQRAFSAKAVELHSTGILSLLLKWKTTDMLDVRKLLSCPSKIWYSHCLSSPCADCDADSLAPNCKLNDAGAKLPRVAPMDIVACDPRLVRAARSCAAAAATADVRRWKPLPIVTGCSNAISRSTSSRSRHGPE